MTLTGARVDSTITLPISTSDLEVSADGEPRIQDMRVAERLGYLDPNDLRELIARNDAELKVYGVLPCHTEKPVAGSRGGRPRKFFHLNEAQTLLLCMFSRTPAAAQVRKEVIEVFLAWRRGRLTEAATKAMKSAIQPKPLSLREKRLLISECRKINGVRAAQQMWKDLDMPGTEVVPAQAEISFSGIQLRDGMAVALINGQHVLVDLSDTAVRTGERALLVRNWVTTPMPFVHEVQNLAGAFGGPRDVPERNAITHIPPIPNSPRNDLAFREVRVLGRIVA